MNKDLFVDASFLDSQGFHLERIDDQGYVAWRKGNMTLGITTDDFIKTIEEHTLAKFGLWPASNGCLITNASASPGLLRSVDVFDPEVPYRLSGWFEGKNPPNCEIFDPGDEWKFDRAVRGYEAAQEYFAAHPKKE